MQQQWERVQDILRTEIGEAAFRNWLQPVSIADATETGISLGAPTRFFCNFVDKHYGDRIRELWLEINDQDVEIQFVVKSSRALQPHAAKPAERPKASLAPPAQETEAAAPPQPEVEATVSDDHDALLSPLDNRYTFDNFVVGKPNEFAWAAARRVSESDIPPFNPLFMYSGVGLGKTHLMHAIAWHIRERDPRRTVAYMTAEKFMHKFVRAIRYNDMMNFKEQLRSLDVLMIDDVQFISDKDSTQEEFFHTFNALMDQGKQIIISADKSPSELQGIEERLKSRLGCGLVADIHATSYELRLGILEAKIEQIKAEQGYDNGSDLIVPRKVLEFLAHKINTNVRELEGALRRVVAHAQLIGRDITLESTQDVLHDLLRARERHVTIDIIQKEVAQHFNIKVADMSSPRRARAVARPRQIAMYLSKQLTPRSLPEIGRKFGGRDHTTVMHAVKKVEDLMKDADFAEEIDLLRRMLEN
jgi:chromosomal replication initiator protein